MDSPVGDDPLGEPEARMFLMMLAKVMDTSVKTLRTGETHLEFTPNTLKCLRVRLSLSETASENGSKLSGFFRRKTELDAALDSIRKNIGCVARVMVKRGKLVQEDIKTYDVMMFPSLTKMELAQINVDAVRGAKGVSEAIVRDCNFTNNARFCQRLNSVRTLRLIRCTEFEWRTLRFVANRLRILQIQGNGFVVLPPGTQPILELPLPDTPHEKQGGGGGGGADSPPHSPRLPPWEALIEMEVSNCGWIEIGDSCRALTRLTTLNLSFNKIVEVPVLSCLGNLRRVNLSGNFIVTLDDVCPFLPHVTELDVSRNKINSIDALPQCTHLETVYLHGNQITSFYGLEDILERMPTLIRIFINENPVFTKVRDTDVISVMRAVFYTPAKRIFIEGIEYGPLANQLYVQLKQKYRKVWEPPMDDEPYSKSEAGTQLIPSAIPVIVCDESETPEQTTETVRSPRKDSTAEIDSINTLKEQWGEDWLRLANKSLTPDEGGDRKSMSPMPSPEASPKRRVTKRIVKKIKPKQSSSPPAERTDSPQSSSPKSHTTNTNTAQTVGSQISDPVFRLSQLGRAQSDSFTKSNVEIPGNPISPRESTYASRRSSVVSRSETTSSYLSSFPVAPSQLPPSQQAPTYTASPDPLPRRASLSTMGSPVSNDEQSDVAAFMSTLTVETKKDRPRTPNISPSRRLGGAKYQEKKAAQAQQQQNQQNQQQQQQLDKTLTRPRSGSGVSGLDRTLRTTPSTVDKSNRPILKAHISTTWKEIPRSLVENRVWTGVQSLLGLLPHHPFTSGHVLCKVFPLVPGPIWEETEVRSNAVEVWLCDALREADIPVMVNRYRDKHLLKLIEISTDIPSVRYICLKHRKLHAWEVDSMLPESKPSTFDATYLTYVHNYSNIVRSDNIGDSRVQLMNVETSQSTLSATSKASSDDLYHPMDGRVQLSLDNVSSIQTSILQVNRARTLCGFVVNTPELAREVAQFLHAKMVIVLDESIHAPDESFCDVGPIDVINSKSFYMATTDGGALHKALERITQMPVNLQRTGSHPRVDEDEIEMHMKTSVFGRCPDMKVLKIFNIRTTPNLAIDTKLHAPQCIEHVVFFSYVNFLFSCDEENDEKSGVIVVSNTCVYFALDYNMSYPALNLPSPYFVLMSCHDRRDLSAMHIGHNFQYVRLTFGGAQSQTYLLLTRDPCVSSGIVSFFTDFVRLEQLATQVVHVASPFLHKPIDDTGVELGYFCMFFSSLPQEEPSLDKTVSIWKKKKSTADFPQTIYPLRHVASDMIPLTLVITKTNLFLVVDNYASWPDAEASGSRYRIFRRSELKELRHIDIVNEKNSLASHALILHVGDEEYDRWTLISQHGTNTQNAVTVLSAAWSDLMRQSLPRKYMNSSSKAELFDCSQGRREMMISSLTTPFKKAFGKQ